MAKTSKLRHTRGHICKPDLHFLNVAPTSAMWDCGNFVACNKAFVAASWQMQGTTAVFRHDQFGKLPSSVPLLRGHAGSVIDLAFHPFNDQFLFTASEDSTIRGWKIPIEGLRDSDMQPVIELVGHGKKVGILSFHPAANDVLASAGVESVVNIWNIEVGLPHVTLKNFSDHPLSLQWNLDGSLICASTKDKKIVVCDSRTGDQTSCTPAHEGIKSQKSVWCKRKNLIVSCGFEKFNQRRELKVWDVRNMAKAVHHEKMDESSCIPQLFYDEDTSLIFVGSKGDGLIRYYEVVDDAVPLLSCNAFFSNDPQRGMGIMPKVALDVKHCEIARFYKMGSKSLHTIHFIIPRKTADMEFQEDLFPPTFGSVPAIGAHEFFQGANAQPLCQDLRGLFDGSPLRIDDKVAFSPTSRPDEGFSRQVSENVKSPADSTVPEPSGESEAPHDNTHNDTEGSVRDIAFDKNQEDTCSASPLLKTAEDKRKELHQAQERLSQLRLQVAEYEALVAELTRECDAQQSTPDLPCFTSKQIEKNSA
jgi:coronin-1B/1C/6